MNTTTMILRNKVIENEHTNGSEVDTIEVEEFKEVSCKTCNRIECRSCLIA